jgi:uncharacterized protein (TIGR00266 family)
MNYEIFGGTLPAVTVRLNEGESIYTQSGGMSWMSDGIQMETNMKGGLMKGIGRLLSGDSLFMATYTSSADGESITVSATLPGTLIALDLSSGPFIAQKDAFLAAEPNVALQAHIPQGWKAGLFGGEGFVLQRLSGQGTAWLELDGSMQALTLAQGEKVVVNAGNVALYEERVNYSAKMVKGFKNILFGGEGLFLATLEGPGKVWLQTMTFPSLAQKILPFVPSGKNS